MSLLRLSILGAPRFEHDSSWIDLPSAKALALLAYLAIAGEPQPRERLFALLWGSSTEEAARKNLRNMLWSIGKTLGDHVLRVDEQHLALSSDVWVDAREFERLASTPDRQAAVELYRGDLLANLAISDAPEYEIWLTGERERFAETYLQLLESLIQDARTRTDWPAVVELARRALGQDNLLEPMYRALMEAHARLGDRTRALQQYEFLKATLRNELDVDPLPETTQLRDAIASGAVGPSVPPIVPAPRAARALHPPAARRIPFVGRQSQLTALDAEWAAAGAGAARTALITGELGIGKSRLWQEWSAPLGDAVLATRCLEATSSVPYAPLSELFRPRPVLRRLLSPTASISPVWLAELARLLPEIRVERPGLPVLAPLPAEEEHRRVLEAFTQCVRALSSPALALFIDDLHWADGATLDWLDYMVHRLADQPILVVATYRPEDAPARLVQMAARWGREGISRRIPVASLNEEEAAALVSALGASLAGTLQQQSGGNPYFLIELAQAGTGTVPPALADLLRARLDRLPGTARQIIQAAAVLEPDFDFATLRRTSGRGEEETLDAVDALLDANVLVERDGTLSFAHPLVGLVVRESLSGARRAFLHRRAAKAIERSAVRPDQFAGRLADHYAEAGDNIRAARYAQAAAQSALALAAPEQALAFYRRAFELDPTPERNMGVGEVLLGQGELVQARREFTTALEAFEAAGDHRGAARAAMKLAESYFPAGQFADAQQWMEKSFELFGAENDPESRALLLLLRGSSELNAGRPGADAELNLRQAAEFATAGGRPAIAAQATFMLGNLLAERGDLSAALTAYEQAVDLARQAGDDYQQVLAYNNLAYHALLLGETDRAHAEIEKAFALAEARALRLPLQHLYSTRGEIALAEKNWQEAEDWFKRGLAEAEHNGNRREQANSHANLGLAAMGRGDSDAAVMLLETARREVSELPEPHLRARTELELAQVYFERGERSAAREALDRARTMLVSSSRKTLQEWTDRLEAQIGPPRRERARRAGH